MIALRRLLSALLLFLAFVAGPVYANWCATPAKNGTAIPSGVVNTYFPGNAPVAVGATSISLGQSTGVASGITAGDLLLVIQMQDATIDTRNNSRYGDGVNGGLGNGYSAIQQTGRYEFVRATNVVLDRYSAKDAFFKQVLDSQRNFAKDVVPYWTKILDLYSNLGNAALQKK